MKNTYMPVHTDSKLVEKQKEFNIIVQTQLPLIGEMKAIANGIMDIEMLAFYLDMEKDFEDLLKLLETKIIQNDMEYMITYLPDFDETRREMGHSAYDDYDSDAVLYQQGYDMLHLLVEPGDTFKIKRKHIQATFQCDGNLIRLFAEHPMFNEIVDEDAIGLEPGKYKLSDDGKSIERLDFEEEDFY